MYLRVCKFEPGSFLGILDAREYAQVKKGASKTVVCEQVPFQVCMRFVSWVTLWFLWVFIVFMWKEKTSDVLGENIFRWGKLLYHAGCFRKGPEGFIRSIPERSNFFSNSYLSAISKQYTASLRTQSLSKGRQRRHLTKLKSCRSNKLNQT